MSAQLILRGIDRADQTSDLTVLRRTALGMVNPVPWNPFPLDLRLDHRRQATPQASAHLLVCRSDAVDPLARAHGRARGMLDVGAYLHWYTRYGCDRETVETAMETVGDIITAYQSLAVNTHS